jgi:hypothetical protein
MKTLTGHYRFQADFENTQNPLEVQSADMIFPIEVYNHNNQRVGTNYAVETPEDIGLVNAELVGTEIIGVGKNTGNIIHAECLFRLPDVDEYALVTYRADEMQDFYSGSYTLENARFDEIEFILSVK